MKFPGKVGKGPLNKRLYFSGDPDHYLDTGIVFRIRHSWEIRKVVNGRKSAAHNDSPDGGTGKTCIGGGMPCPGASSSRYLSLYWCTSGFVVLRLDQSQQLQTNQSRRVASRLKPNCIALASSELAPNMFAAGSCQISLH